MSIDSLPAKKNNESWASDSNFHSLLLKARSGDTESLGQLLQWYGNYLTILATTQLDNRLRRRVNPSDIVQEAMLAAHQDFADFRGQIKPLTSPPSHSTSSSSCQRGGPRPLPQSTDQHPEKRH